MANTLTSLIPTIYQALDTVSRDQVGMIPAVSLNASAAMAAKDQTIMIPIVPTNSAADITPAVTAPDTGDATIGNTTMTISKARAVPIRWNGEETTGLNNAGTYGTISADRFAQAFRALGNEVESDLTALHADASRAYGTAGTTPFASVITDVPQLRKILVDNGAPTSDLRMVVDSAAGANLRSLGQFTYVNQSGTDETLRRGVLGDISGFAVGESGQTVTSTAGTGTGYTSSTAGFAVGITDIAIITGSGTVVAGDVITFAGDSNKYVVESGVAAPGTITIAEPGLKEAIAASAVNMTIVAAAARNMAFDRGAIQLITRAPAMPEGGDAADDVVAITDPLSGVTYQIAMYRQYRQTHIEVGLAWGVKTTKPEHLCLLLG